MTVCWSGTQDAQGVCPSLVSDYHVSSSLTNAAYPGRLRPGDLTALQRSLGVRSRPARRTRSEAQRARDPRTRHRGKP